jgi:Beta-galactosidase/beta-glucuronidase
MKNNIPRAEYPNPQFERTEWQNLNGEWEFAFDLSNSGLERGFQNGSFFTHKIIVPFVPESSLSGLQYQDFMQCIWYGKKFDLPTSWTDGRIFLNFGAVDYYCELWVNGVRISEHRGSSAPFSTDITHFVISGENSIVLRVFDETRSGKQTLGKQSTKYDSHGCHYTRTTGIWQTVWMEYIPSEAYIKNYKIIPDPENKKAYLTVNLCGQDKNGTLIINALYNGASVSRAEIVTFGKLSVNLTLSFDEIQLWEIGNGRLYDLELTYQTETGTDTVNSYFGMRSISLTKNEMLLNGKPVFQRLVLDQGYYPDGVWTAPSDEALRNDILLSLAAGFNGARLHQKVFEPRFLYHADKLGYIVWGENASWGMDLRSGEAFEGFMGEWHELLNRDFNHPSIIGWCPFNETYQEQRSISLINIYEMTKNFDPTRPVIDTSGYVHVKTDVFDIHNYEQDPEKFKAFYQHMNEIDGVFKPFNPHNINMNISERLPYFVSEYGGTWWNEEEAKSSSSSGWGYGQRPTDIEEVYHRIEGLTKALLENKGVCAFCYTQLTDVHPEFNGIYTFDRKPKFELDRIKKIFSAKAEIEN